MPGRNSKRTRVEICAERILMAEHDEVPSEADSDVPELVSESDDDGIDVGPLLEVPSEEDPEDTTPSDADVEFINTKALDPTCPLQDGTTPDCGLSVESMSILEWFQIPMIVFQILAILNRSPKYQNFPDLNGIEYFAGHAAVSRHLRAQTSFMGHSVLSYDIKHGPLEDWNGAAGFITAIQWWRRLLQHELVWLGTVCSSWIFMCMGSSGRSIRDPRGSTQYAAIRDGNAHVARSALMMALTYACNQCFVLEQPGSSLMPHHPALKWIRQRAHDAGFVFHIVETFMFQFGGKTLKPTILLSNNKWTHGSVRKRPYVSKSKESARMVKTYTRSDGKRRCTGTKGLKSTQQYPEGFGHAVADNFINQRETFNNVPDQHIVRYDQDLDEEDDPWEDLDLERSLAWLLEEVAPIRS